MAITIVAAQSGVGKVNSGTTIPVTMAQSPAQGNLLIAVISLGQYEGQVTSITQTGVTWTVQSNLYASSYDVEIWAGVVGASADTAVTVNTNAASLGNGATAAIYEFTGLLTSGFLDKVSNNSGTGTLLDTGTTAQTTQPNELWVGGVTFSHGNDPINPTNGFTMPFGSNEQYMSSAFLYKIVSATGQANSGVTNSPSDVWVGCIATFIGSSQGNISDIYTGTGIFTLTGFIHAVKTRSPALKLRKVINKHLLLPLGF
jgi:hypothetical protein